MTKSSTPFHQSALGFDLAARQRGDDGFGPGDAAEHGVWGGEIQLSHARVDRFDNAKGSVGHGVLMHAGAFDFASLPS
jgi:hypothetical protein